MTSRVSDTIADRSIRSMDDEPALPDRHGLALRLVFVSVPLALLATILIIANTGWPLIVGLPLYGLIGAFLALAMIGLDSLRWSN